MAGKKPEPDKQPEKRPARLHERGEGENRMVGFIEPPGEPLADESRRVPVIDGETPEERGYAGPAQKGRRSATRQ